jgi:hypothetical protein
MEKAGPKARFALAAASGKDAPDHSMAKPL